MACAYILLAYLAQPSAIKPDVDITPYVAEAAHRTGIPQPVIWAVIGVESRGNLRATSPKGAMGLMQLMPRTWSQLRTQLDLKEDAFDPHDNIIAGTYYLRFLYDRYGWTGMFAAYNAGPGRYELHRNSSRPLPAETQDYVARIADKLGGQNYVLAPPTVAIKVSVWTDASLFVADTDPAEVSVDGFTTVQTPFIALPASSDVPPH